jgi:hypothetical protein
MFLKLDSILIAQIKLGGRKEEFSFSHSLLSIQNIIVALVVCFPLGGRGLNRAMSSWLHTYVNERQKKVFVPPDIHY